MILHMQIYNYNSLLADSDFWPLLSDDLYKQFEPRSGPTFTKNGADQDASRLDTYSDGVLERIF